MQGPCRARATPIDPHSKPTRVCSPYFVPKCEACVMSTDGQFDIDRAKKYILEHPDQTKAQQAVALRVSTSTIARARAQLVDEGFRPPSRKTSKATVPGSSAHPPARSPVEESGQQLSPQAPAHTTLDHAALSALVEMTEMDLDLSDEEIMKRLLKQCLMFAFDARLHPDTRMSASNMWAKFKEQKQQKAHGPGAPVDFAQAVEWTADILIAVGPSVSIAAINKAFDVKESPDAGKQEAPESNDAPSLPSQAPGAADNDPHVPGEAG